MQLILRALGGLAFLLGLLGAILFGVSGTFDYPASWAFLATFGGCTLLITLYLMFKDRALLERRTQAGPLAESEASQRIIQTFGSLSFIGIFAVSALDHRLGWTQAPDWLPIAGNLMVALGLFLVFLVFRANTYTSGTIEVAEGQSVISTGPYAIVRHPMYAGASPLVFGAPLALGSLWGLAPALAVFGVVVVRLLEEEKFLEKHLTGYSAYRTKVRSRLVPFVW